MGPDCGTAIIGGAALAFANIVPRGDIGIVGASGTGIQEVSCLIAQAGRGISHAIGTGGRDLKAEVGGITTLMAIDLFDADPATRHIVIVSKPPAAEVAAKVLERVGRSSKPFTICFLGDTERAMPKNARAARRLPMLRNSRPASCRPKANAASRPAERRHSWPFRRRHACCRSANRRARRGLEVTSNAPVPGPCNSAIYRSSTPCSISVPTNTPAAGRIR